MDVSGIYQDEVAEWLRRWTANPMGSARVGSNPILVVKMVLDSVRNFYFKFITFNTDIFFVDESMAKW